MWQTGPAEMSSRPANTRDGRFGSKVGQIGPKWDKSGAFSDQISVHLARGIWKNAGFVALCANLAYFWTKFGIHAHVLELMSEVVQFIIIQVYVNEKVSGFSQHRGY